MGIFVVATEVSPAGKSSSYTNTPFLARQGRSTDADILLILFGLHIYCCNTAKPHNIYLQGAILLILIDQQRDLWLEGGFWGEEEQCGLG